MDMEENEAMDLIENYSSLFHAYSPTQAGDLEKAIQEFNPELLEE
jgi:hypothetical protein